MSSQWKGDTRWGYRWFQLPQTDRSHYSRSKVHLELWTSMKNTDGTYYILWLVHFHLTNSSAWLLTSKAQHETLWDQDLCLGHWGFFGWVVWVSLLSCASVIRINDFILFWAAVLFWRQLLTLWKSGYRELQAVWHCGNGWQKLHSCQFDVWKCPPSRRSNFLSAQLVPSKFCEIVNFMALFSPLSRSLLYLMFSR